MVSTMNLQAIMMRKELKWLMVHGAILEVVVLLSVSVVAQCLELHTLLYNELCLIVVEEEEVVVVICLLEGFVCQYSYMEGVQECVRVPRRLMISAKVMASEHKKEMVMLVVAIVVAVETGIDWYMG